MDISAKEIIDLTGDHEVIVLDSEHEDTAPGPSKARTTRRSPLRANEDADGSLDTVEGSSRSVTITRPSSPDADLISQGQDNKRRRTRRKKKRSIAVAEQDGEEEGEIVEVPAAEESTGERVKGETAPRSGDTQGSTTEGNSNKRKRKRKERGRSPYRHAPPDDPQQSGITSVDSSTSALPEPKDTKEPRKREKGRKRREKVREPELENHSRTRPRSKCPEELPLFFVDEAPAEIPSNVKPAGQPSRSKASDTKPEETHPTLILPAHVMVFEGEGEPPLEILLQPSTNSDDEDYIEYLDYDDDRRGPGLVRYFDDLTEIAAAKAAKATRIVCKNCGAEGEHRTYECRVIICLTCGARDEHTTRSCPISKTCFSCGMKGHLSRTCPNRFSARANHCEDCDRCGSSLHNTNECPTLWRMYEYVEDTERQTILRVRDQKRDLAIGEGGEGYIAPEDWCYNCGGCGHLGDDCQELTDSHDFPHEPSAFSEYNTMTGPFYDLAHPTERAPSKAAAYAAQAKRAWGDGYGHVLPLDVGKQARNKERTRLEKRAEELQDEEDNDDWFAGRRRNSSGRNGGDKKSLLERLDSKKISIGSLDRDSRRFGRDSRENGRRESDSRRAPHYDDLPRPMRETETLQIRGASKRNSDRDGSIRGAGSSRDDLDAMYEQRKKVWSRHRDKRSPERRRDRDGRGHSPRREPRYRGGYAR